MSAPAIAVREGPILMSGPMVRATLDDRKTQSRRVAKLPADAHVDHYGHPFRCLRVKGGWHREEVLCPYGLPGDRLWVRENWWRDERDPGVVIYDATAEFGKYQNSGKVVRSEYPNTGITGERPSREDMEREMATNRFWSRRPSIFMPRWASRITLELTGVRVERVQDITEADALAEGMIDYDRGRDSAVDQFHDIWDSLNAKRGYGWDVNPWVWVLEFAKVAA